MSIDSVKATIAELEARIRALSPTPPSVQQPAPLDPARASSAGPAPAGPFPVALAQAMGDVRLRAVAKTFTPEIESLITRYSGQNGLDPTLVRAVITAESDGNQRSVSSKGAMGLMQLMPGELKEYGITDAFDPEQNIMGGTRQLAEKLKLFNGDLSLALAAYNAGTGNVRKYNGIPPFPETQAYVKKILAMLDRQ